MLHTINHENIFDNAKLNILVVSYFPIMKIVIRINESMPLLA